jgi:5,10-methylenetetrahydromethanopterin reductase
VTAGAAATLDEVSGGRGFLGIGGGDSALYNIGLKGAGVAQIEEYVATIRTLYRNNEAEFQGRNVRLAWTRHAVPVYMAASGPKGLRAAGRCADGVIVGTGVLPEVVGDALAQIDAGAKESGRRVEDLDIWWLLMGGLDADPQKALDDVKHSLTTYANLAFRFSMEGKHLPAQFYDAVKRIHTEYRAKDHVTGGAKKEHARLADETGLTQYLASRFALAGTPHQVLEQAARANRAGARQLWITLRFPGKERFFRHWEEGVAPALD